MPPVIVMYNFLNYGSLGTHEEERESQKQFKLLFLPRNLLMILHTSSSPKASQKSFWMVQQKIEENAKKTGRSRVPREVH